LVRIAHVSDIHIRNFKYHSEYRETFRNLYTQLRELRPDVIVNTGDTAHSKLQISPELVQMVAEHLDEVSSIAPYVVMLGNHDLNLHNLGRVDAISPIAAQFNGVFLLKKSRPLLSDELSLARHKFTFWPLSMADVENFPTREQVEALDGPHGRTSIGLFHGSVAGCVTDSEWTMADAETDVRAFDHFHYVLMGDIHKQQFFRERRVAYAGSLIQQNFGESHDKGFLLWDIEDSRSFEVRHVPVQSPLKFRTLRATDELTVPVSQTTSRGAYVRVFVPRAISATEQRALVSEVKRDFQAKEVICVLSPEAQDAKERPLVEVAEDDLTNVRDLSTQERLLRQYLEDRGVDDETIQRVVELNRRAHASVEEEDLARNSRWRLNKIGWSNLFSYGEGNIIDFSERHGQVVDLRRHQRGALRQGHEGRLEEHRARERQPRGGQGRLARDRRPAGLHHRANDLADQVRATQEGREGVGAD
jgi:DNA repair exonuclease SbcCD nuclease subunit